MSKLILKNCSALCEGTFRITDIRIDGEIISQIDPSLSGDTEIDLSGKKVVPGFIDVHTHGGAGTDFNLATEEEVFKVTEFFTACGVTGYMPTLLTDSDETILRQIRLLLDVRKRYPQILGIHLEGPFLSKEYKGAMPEHLLQKPDFKTFMKYYEAAGGNIKKITLSPELEGAPEFTKQVAALGVSVSLGHSGATYARAMECVENGANCFTHTFNAMRQLHHHETGVVGAALLSDCYAEAIPDGLHLSPETVRLITKMKSPDKMLIITDSIMAAGLPDGNYMLGVNKVTVKNGDARLTEGDARAGSTLKFHNGVLNYCKFTGYPLEAAVKRGSENQAAYLKLDDRGSIAKGKRADLLILDADNQIESVYVGGKKFEPKIPC